MKCKNQNHSKLNVLVRFCYQCGKLVNEKISKKQCTTDFHSLCRKEGKQFCSQCGNNLR